MNDTNIESLDTALAALNDAEFGADRDPDLGRLAAGRVRKAFAANPDYTPSVDQEGRWIAVRKA